MSAVILLTLMLVQYVIPASALSDEYLQNDLTISLLGTFCLINFYRKTGPSAELLPIDWLTGDWLTAEWLIDDWFLVYPGFSTSSKFQIKNVGTYWLGMLNFVISNRLNVTILNTLNPFVPFYVTLLPLSQPVWTPTRVILGCFNGQAWLIWELSGKI
jgi:hypothetical protein